jgi:hypothetical protein
MFSWVRNTVLEPKWQHCPAQMGLKCPLAESPANCRRQPCTNSTCILAYDSKEEGKRCFHGVRLPGFKSQCRKPQCGFMTLSKSLDPTEPLFPSLKNEEHPFPCDGMRITWDHSWKTPQHKAWHTVWWWVKAYEALIICQDLHLNLANITSLNLTVLMGNEYYHPCTTEETEHQRC